MSVSLYKYNPKYCDGEPCPGDCDLCNKWQEFPEEDENERAIEQTEHDMLYEPTYNSEDGSM